MYQKITVGVVSIGFMILFILSVLSSTAVSVFGANDIDSQIRQKADELNAIKRQKQELEKKRQIALEAERSVEQNLKSIDRELTKREKELQLYNDKLDVENSKLKAVQLRINDLGFQSDQRKSIMKNRLRSFYKLSYQLPYFNDVGIFKIKNQYELLGKQYFNSIVSSDEQYLERLIVERRILYNEKGNLERDKNLILVYKGKISQEKSKFLRDKSKRQVLLVEYRNQKEAYTRTLEQLERSVVQLESLIAKLRSAQSSSDEQLGLQLSTLSLDELGVLSWPILGRVIPNAIPELKGITIRADYGEDVKTIYDGIVEYAGWFDAIGLGQLVIIYHGHNYRSIYAHLSEILVKPGSKVKRDQTIGRAGDIGGSGRSALYFEIRRGPYAVDARRWLR